MAVSLRDPQDGDLAELSEINVTPLIDVMLVLLIIFMVAAPLSTVDVAVDLPVSSAPPQARPDKPVFLSVKPDLTLALGNDDVPRGALQAALDRQTNSDRQQRIFLRADGVVAYRDLMGVMNLLRGTGYLRVRWSDWRIPGRAVQSADSFPALHPRRNRPGRRRSHEIRLA